MNERERIAFLARTLGRAAPGVVTGIGDDAAVLDAAGRLVWTLDEQVEGTHFRRDLLGLRDVGWRSFMAAASDVAAMGAAPWCALSGLVLPDDVDDAGLAELVRGQREAAEEARAPVVGGNLARGPALSITTTVLGRCQRAVERRGAQPGDGVWLAGSIGLAAAGLAALLAGLGDGALDVAREAWRRPTARFADGLALAGRATAAIDVSDGLARDVGHLAEASGVRVLLEASELVEPALAAAAASLGRDPLDLALHGGEDYALVATAPVPIPGFRRVGAVLAGEGLALRTGAVERPLEPLGYDHFTSPSRRPGASDP